jgi:hypothetical protein
MVGFSTMLGGQFSMTQLSDSLAETHKSATSVTELLIELERFRIALESIKFSSVKASKYKPILHCLRGFADVIESALTPYQTKLGPFLESEPRHQQGALAAGARHVNYLQKMTAQLANLIDESF